MKNIFLLFLLFPLFAFSKNYTTFGGGNYLYVETGSIHFNLDKHVFDHRTWVYDGQNFTSQINVPVVLKTKYFSNNEWLQVVLKNQNDGFMYTNYIKEPFSLKNHGRYQAVALPLIPVFATVGGFVARQFAFNSFKSAAVANAAGGAALLAFCTDLVNTGVDCTSDGFSKTLTVSHIVTLSNGNVYRVKDAQDYHDQVIPDLVEFIASYYGAQVNPEDCHGGSMSQGSSFQCGYYSPGSWAIKEIKNVDVTETIPASDADLMPAFERVAQAMPSQVINEPTDGKNVPNVALTSASTAPTSVLSAPYTHPTTGAAQQDEIFIGAASSGIGVNSATNTSWEYTPTLGQSAVVNPATVTTIARPDLTGDRTLAPVGVVTTQTGVANPPTTSNPPTTGDIEVNVEFPEFTDIAEFCKANPDAGACLNLKPDESQSVPLVVPIEEIGLDFNVTSFFSSDGICPAPAVASISMFGVNRNLSLSFEPTCKFAEMFRYIVLILAWFLAFKIVMGRE